MEIRSGVVDGHRGEFTDKALDFYREAKGLPKGYLPDTSNIEPYTTYAITAEDKAMIGTMAEKPEELAKQKRLPYVSMTELLGERFHTTPGFLGELNPGVNIEALPVGAVIKVTNVHRPFRVGDYPSAYPAPPKSVALTRHVYVDTKTRMLEVRDGGKLIAAFRSLPAPRSTRPPWAIGKSSRPCRGPGIVMTKAYWSAVNAQRCTTCSLPAPTARLVFSGPA